MLFNLRYALRAIRHSPAAAAAAVLTLALTLGAGGSIFAVVDAVLLTPPPFVNPEALALAGETPPDALAAAPRPVRYATLEAWRARAASLAMLEAFDGTNLTLTGLDGAERVSATDVTPGLLPLLGVKPALGRGFADDDLGQHVVIISDRFWRRRLAADPHVVGRQIALGSQPHTIVGVLPDRFAFAFNPSEIWRPIPLTHPAANADYRVLVIARLAGPVTMDALTAALDGVSRTSTPIARASTIPLTRAIQGDIGQALGLLMGAAAVALLVACANLAGLLIVRSIDRGRELAVRSALGAQRRDIATQLLAEAAGLVAIGIAGGVLLASWLTPVAGRLALDEFGAVANREIAVSWRVIGVTSLAAALCAAVCALAPVLMAARRSGTSTLQRATTAAPGQIRLRRAFVIGEVAIAFVLLVSMAQLGRSLIDVLAIDPGFDDGVLTTGISLPAADYADDGRVASFYASLQAAVDERLGPGVVSIVDELPLTGDRGRVRVSRKPSLQETDGAIESVIRAAGPGYFEIIRIPIVAGRGFDGHDDATAPRRVVISRRLAQQLFGSERPIGRDIQVGRAAAEVIGIVGDVTHRALDEPPSRTIYVSAAQAPSRSSRVVIRSAMANAAVITVIRTAVAGLDGNVPVYGTRPMRELVDRSPGVAQRRLLTASYTGFALLALVLGAIGLFGVVAHDVARRRAELALRMALGAGPTRILTTTLAQGATMLATGLAIGGVLSVWASRGLGSAVAGTGALDMTSVGLAAAMLVASSVIALLPAAKRATRTDPLLALRGE